MKRRTFIKTAGGAVAVWLTPLGMIRSSILTDSGTENSGSDVDFLNPPAAARPWVYWYWINGNITKAGITADLEAMQRVGIGGAFLAEVDGSPQGPVTFGSDTWKEMFRFTCAEATRLGIEITMNDGAGWTGSGGPWNTPENSMQRVYYSEITVAGGKTLTSELPQPDIQNAVVESMVHKKSADEHPEYYRDIAIIAFPTPRNNDFRNANIALKAGYIAGSTPPSMKPGDVGRFKVLPVAIEPTPADATIDQGRIIDLTADYHQGLLTWEVPPGNWTIIRFGHGSTGATNHPSPPAGMGLECDKMSKEAVEFHFNHYVGEMMKFVGPQAGKSVVGMHVDSWEVGCQTWTKAFPEEFKRRCGYDIVTYLPAMTGRIIGSAEITERFLWDLRFTISELIAENYAGHLRELADRNGIVFSMEALDNTPFDEIRVAGQAHLPQTEFWYRNNHEPEAVGESGDRFNGVIRSYAWTPAMVSAAHIYGRKIIPSEAFSANLGENWQAHPAMLKPQGDWAFSAGVNRFLFHRFALQPWLNRKPGMAMAYWGQHYERTQTWWEETKPWHEYVARCQYMLQKGLFVADLLYMQAEAVPNRFIPPGVDFANPNSPDTPGYNYDGCTADVVFNRITLKDGRMLLPDGMSYRLMVLPAPGEQVMAGVMTIKLAKKIEELVAAGMIVVGPPPVRTPGLNNYPACEDELKQIVGRLWGDTSAAGERKVGKGRVIWGTSPQKVLHDMGLPPDFSCGTPAPFRYTHRRADDGTEIYFVANKLNAAVEATCSFRVSGRRPEFWWPETGQRENPAMYSEANEGISLPLHLAAFESVFVIFRPNSQLENDRLVQVLRNGSPIAKDLGSKIRISRRGGKFEHLILESGAYSLRTANNEERTTGMIQLPEPLKITGSWDLQFAPDWGAPAAIQLPELRSWSDHADAGVRYFSGKATYRKTIMIPASRLTENQRLFLDLGAVEVIARVKLNGQDLGILWKKPFIVDVTAAARVGENLLEVMVVNLWPNRMIGDASLPEDCIWTDRSAADAARYSPKRITHAGVPAKLVEYPKWFVENQPSPSGRYTFSTVKVWHKDDPLLKSGLLGPVLLKTVVVSKL